MRARIETLVYRDLYAVRALATHIASLPELDRVDFEAYVKLLTQEPTTLRRLAAAADLVIRYLYPLAGNETVLGTDYRQLPSQRVDVERTIASRTLMINRPTLLIQGGYGFIAREAVFLHSAHGPQKLWGVVSAAVDRDTLYSVSGLRELGLRLEIAIRAVDIADTECGQGLLRRCSFVCARRGENHDQFAARALDPRCSPARRLAGHGPT